MPSVQEWGKSDRLKAGCVNDEGHVLVHDYVSFDLNRHAVGWSSSSSDHRQEYYLKMREIFSPSACRLPSASSYWAFWRCVTPVLLGSTACSHHDVFVSASRSFHSSPATTIEAAPVVSSEPSTKIAQRGSTQLSLETPNNAAGQSDYPTCPMKVYFASWLPGFRVCAIYS
jgi:hypothetical protein